MPSFEPTPGDSPLFSFSELLTIMGLVIAVIAIVVTVFVTRTYGTRRSQLIVDTRNVKKIAICLRMPDGKEEIIEPDPPIQYIVQVRLTNKGPQDVTVDAFNGVPLSLSLGASTTGILTSNTLIGLDLKGKQARLQPRQIPRGTIWQWEIHTMEEYPYLTVSSPITNVDVKVRQYPDSTGNGAAFGEFGFSGSQDWWKGRVLRY